MNCTETDNPFIYDRPVTRRDFVGRRDEISRAMGLAKSGKSFAITGRDGLGKTSLLLEIERKCSTEFEVIKLNMRGIADSSRFVERMIRSILGHLSTRHRGFGVIALSLINSERLRLAAASSLATRPDEHGAEEHGKKVAEVRLCLACAGPLKWIEKYSRYYCYSCKKYVSRRRCARLPNTLGFMPIAERCPACESKARLVEKYCEYYCDVCGKYLHPRTSTGFATGLTDADITEAFDLPRRIAEHLDRRLLLAFDDFQDVLCADDGRIAKMIRSMCEAPKYVTCVFSGDGARFRSAIHDRGGALEWVAEEIRLMPIPEPELEDFLIDRFRSAGGDLTRRAARRVSGVSGGIPYFAQLIGHQLFHISRTPTSEDVEKAIGLAVEKQRSTYALIWDSIENPMYRRYLLAVATEPLVPRGNSFIQRHGLKSRSHVERIETYFKERGLIEDREIADPLFLQWLRAHAFP